MFQNYVTRSDSFESTLCRIGSRPLPVRTCLYDSRRGHSFPGAEKSSRRGSRLSVQPWGAAAPQATGGRPIPGLRQIQIRDRAVNIV